MQTCLPLPPWANVRGKLCVCGEGGAYRQFLNKPQGRHRWKTACPLQPNRKDVARGHGMSNRQANSRQFCRLPEGSQSISQGFKRRAACCPASRRSSSTGGCAARVEAAHIISQLNHSLLSNLSCSHCCVICWAIVAAPPNCCKSDLVECSFESSHPVIHQKWHKRVRNNLPILIPILSGIR